MEQSREYREYREYLESTPYLPTLDSLTVPTSSGGLHNPGLGCR